MVKAETSPAAQLLTHEFPVCAIVGYLQEELALKGSAKLRACKSGVAEAAIELYFIPNQSRSSNNKIVYSEHIYIYTSLHSNLPILHAAV